MSAPRWCVLIHQLPPKPLYLPGGKSETMAILGVTKAGKLSLLSTVKTARAAHCVVADDHHQAWVCDPGQGRLLLVDDTYPATE